MEKSTITRILHGIGTLLSLGLVVYVLQQSFSSFQSSEFDFSARTLAVIGLGFIPIVLGTFMLPTNYVLLLSNLDSGDSSSDKFTIWKIYARTQIYKYLPGNVFHFVGRQMEIAKFGVANGAIANASILELLSQGFAAGLCVALFGNFQLPAIFAGLALTGREYQFVAIAFVIGFTACAWIIYYLRRNNITLSFTACVTILMIHALFFLLSGVGLYVILIAMNLESVYLYQCVIIFCIAWFLGTVVPGASAGIGVREAIIVALGYLFIDQNLATAALLLRLMTVAADGVLWLAGLGRNPTKPGSRNAGVS